MAGVIILVSAAIGIAPLALKEASLESVKVNFNSSVTVNEAGSVNMTDLGINAGQHLRFGRIEQNANYTKWVNVGVNERSRVKLESKGNISELLRHEEVMYIKGQSRIPIELVPQEAGYYEGEVVLRVWRPKNRLGELYIDYWHWKDRNF